MTNWAKLVQRSIQAEVPQFELLRTFLDTASFKDVVISRLAAAFNFHEDTWNDFEDSI
jgi:hypothetical protein